MANFAITGTSGVGKSFLEKELEEKYGFHRMATYTDREGRPEEANDPGRICISKDEYSRIKDEFVFTLDYHGNRYGWKRKEMEDNKEKNTVFVVTLDAMTRIVKDIEGTIPILLHIDPNNVDLLESRLKKREDFDNLDDKIKMEVQEKINQRISMALSELGESQKYFDVVSEYNGKVFEIKDDSTLFDEVIPWVMNRT